MYILSVYTVLFLGYLTGILLETKNLKFKLFKHTSKKLKDFNKQYLYMTIVGLILGVITVSFRTGSFFISKHDIVNQGALYYSLLERKVGKIQLYIEYLRILCGPLLFLVNILYFNKFNELNRKTKILGGLNVLLLPYLSLKLGNDKYMIDFVFIIFISIMIFVIKRKIKLFKLCLVFLMFLILGMSTFKQFTNRKLSRIEGSRMLIKDDNSDVYSDRNNVFIKNLDEKTKDGLIMLTSYLTQGYYGTALALEENYSPTYGFGHSMFLLENVKKINIEVYESSYLKKIENRGWVYGYRWSGIYPWIASDITFPGSLIIFYLWGFLLALSFSEMIKNESFIAVGLFYTLIIGTMYFPANNQLFQSPESFFTTYFFIIIFVLKFCMKNIKRKLKN